MKSHRHVVLHARHTAVVLLFGAVVGCESTGSEDTYVPRPRGTLTYTRDIAPIVFEKCATCHRPEGAGPFNLLTYEDVKERATLIGAVIESRREPPWQPEPGRGRFVGERRLTVDQIGMFRQWVDEGTAEGDPNDLPPVATFPGGWQLGTPDLVVTMPEPYTLPAEGGEQFRNFVIPIPSSGTRYVVSAELRLHNRRPVHHAMIMTNQSGSARRADERDSAPGYDDDMFVSTDVQVPAGFFLGWAPGRVQPKGSPDLSWRLEPGTDFVLQMHLRPTGEPEVLMASIGLHFADRLPRQPVTTVYLGSLTMDIPPGESNYLAEDQFVLPVDVEVIGIFPHAHHLGKDLKGFATLPDQTREWLIHIKDWDVTRQQSYEYVEPLLLSRGTTLTMQYTFDNSADNPRNPTRPPRRVRFGPRSADEMADLWIRVVTRDSRDLAVLHQALAQKNLERGLAVLQHEVRLDPNNEQTLINLGNILAATERYTEAIGHYRRLLESNPQNANAYYNLGYALQMRGDVEEAIRQYRAAVRLVPGHVSAHNNLGNALWSVGQIDEAIGHYQTALRINRNFADAHHNLAAALANKGNIEQAIRHEREAIRLRPGWAQPFIGLAWTLATHADDAVRRPSEAVELAKRASLLTSYRDPTALNALAAAYAAVGQFDRAVQTGERAVRVANAAGAIDLARDIRELLQLYTEGRAFRQPARPGS